MRQHSKTIHVSICQNGFVRTTMLSRRNLEMTGTVVGTAIYILERKEEDVL
jgi:hypothetical protein